MDYFSVTVDRITSYNVCYTKLLRTSTAQNFYIWTDDIYGEWSDPVIVDQDRIDPSLYFEEGHCYFMSNGTDASGVSGIIQCEVEIESGKKLSPGKSRNNFV